VADSVGPNPKVSIVMAALFFRLRTIIYVRELFSVVSTCWFSRILFYLILFCQWKERISVSLFACLYTFLGGRYFPNGSVANTAQSLEKLDINSSKQHCDIIGRNKLDSSHHASSRENLGRHSK
jgi:hypothetical protein